MKNFTTPAHVSQPRDLSGRFTTESALIQQWNAEAQARAERAERNRQFAQSNPAYAAQIEAGDILFA